MVTGDGCHARLDGVVASFARRDLNSWAALPSVLMLLDTGISSLSAYSSVNWCFLSKLLRSTNSEVECSLKEL
jgi:hypothetical protein